MRLKILILILTFLTYASYAGIGGGSSSGKQLNHSLLAGGSLTFRGNLDGVGDNAMFETYSETDMAVDASGTVFIMDNVNSSIRKMTVSGSVGTVETYKVNITSTIGMVSDGLGNLFIMRNSSPNTRIRKISASGVITSFALVSSTAMTDLKIDNNTKNLYLSLNCAIYKITSQAVVTLFSGTPGSCAIVDGVSTTAQFSNASRLTVNPNTEDLYVAEPNNQIIRKVTSAGTVTAFAGLLNTSGSTNGTSATARFSGPNDITYDTSLNQLFVVDGGNRAVRKIDLSGNVTTFSGLIGSQDYIDGVSSTARFSGPFRIATNNSGIFYVADRLKLVQGIRQISSAGTVNTVAGATPSLIGDVNGTGSSARFGGIYDITFDSSGNAYVIDNCCGGFKVKKITPRGVVTTTATVPGYNGENGKIVFHPNGKIYTSNYYSPITHQITTSGVVTLFAGSTQGTTDGVSSTAQFYFLGDLAVNSTGDIFVADQHGIRKIDSAGTVSTFAGNVLTSGYLDGVSTTARFNNISALAFDENDNLYVGEYGGAKIRKITPAGTVSTFVGVEGSNSFLDGTGNSARVNGINSMVSDKNNNIYFCDNTAVRKMTTAGVVTTFAGRTTSSSGIILSGARLGPLPGAVNSNCSIGYYNKIIYNALPFSITIMPAK